MSLDESIAHLARNQHALVALQQVRALGGERRHLDRRVRAGTLEQVNHHVYRIAGCVPTWEQQVLASVLGAGPGAIASHATAAALWDLEGFRRRGRGELSIPRGRYHRPADARCHESTDLERCQVILRDGIPTTDLGRTLLDLGRYHNVARLRRIVEDARRRHRVEWEVVIGTLVRHARRGRHGVRRLRNVIALDVDRREVTDSDFELLVLALLAERGVPTPVLHHRVYVGDVLVAELDLAWPDRKVAVELNGRLHREVAEVWERDHLKLVELQALGWHVLPFTWEAYAKRSDWLVRRVRQALER